MNRFKKRDRTGKERIKECADALRRLRATYPEVEEEVNERERRRRERALRGEEATK